MPRDNESRYEKRKEQLAQIMNDNKDVSEKEAIQNLYNQIESYKRDETKLGMDEVKNLIALYEACGIAFKKSYDAARKNNQEDKAASYYKLMKKFSKDYSALYKYARKLNNGLEENKQLGIEAFYDNYRTRTVDLGAKSLNDLNKAGSGMSVRYVVPVTVKDEPITGMKEGDEFNGFFTEDVKYDKNTSVDKIEKAEDYKISRMIKAKYPEFSRDLKALEDQHSNWYDLAIAFSYSELKDKLRTEPEKLLIDKEKDILMKMLDDAVKQLAEDKKPELEGNYYEETFEAFKEAYKDMDNNQKESAVRALLEYSSQIIKAEFGRNVLDGIGVDHNAPVGQRNALMSSMADILGCSDSIAFSEKLNVKTLENGKVVTKKGVVMMPAKGIDPASANLKDPYNQLDKSCLENSKGLIKNVASLQFLDYVCGNTDRHAFNFFFQFDKDGKVIGIQGIDNDNSFGAREGADNLGNAVPFEHLRVIPKSMADAVLALKPETYAVLLQGHGLNEKEIANNIKHIAEVQQQLKASIQHYKDAVPGYLDEKVPRIVEDAEMDAFSFNEQLVYGDPETQKYNIFGRMASGTQKTNSYTKITNMNKKLAKDAYTLDSVRYEKGPGTLNGNLDDMKEQLKAMTTDTKGKPKKLNKQDKARFDSFKNMMDKTTDLLSNEAFNTRYIKNSLNKVGGVTGEDIYEFFGTAYKEADKEGVTFKDATIESDARYIAINEAYEATEEYLMQNEEVGMTYQELQMDVSMAKNTADKKKAIEAFNKYTATNECKQYLTAVEHKKKLGEALDKLVSIHKDAADLTEAGKRCAAIEVSDRYTGSQMQEQAKKKVADINKAQAEKKAEMEKKAEKPGKGMGM